MSPSSILRGMQLTLKPFLHVMPPNCSRQQGGLLLKALDCGSKGPRFYIVPLAAEISFSSGCTQPYTPKIK